MNLEQHKIKKSIEEKSGKDANKIEKEKEKERDIKPVTEKKKDTKETTETEDQTNAYLKSVREDVYRNININIMIDV